MTLSPGFNTFQGQVFDAFKCEGNDAKLKSLLLQAQVENYSQKAGQKVEARFNKVREQLGQRELPRRIDLGEPIPQTPKPMIEPGTLFFVMGIATAFSPRWSWKTTLTILALVIFVPVATLGIEIKN